MRTHKKHSILGLMVIAFIALTSCSKIKDAIQADVDIPAGTINIDIPKIETTGEQKIAGTDNISAIDLSSYSGIKSVTLKSIKVELKEQNPDVNFKVLEKLSVEISSAGLESKVLASVTNTDYSTNKYSIDIPVTGGNINIQDFVKNTFSYTIKGKAHSTTNTPMPAKLTAVYTVKFGL
ncbi:hypothetical protein [Pseudopedobacter beijingensis]|uniref:Uncharacterized protein n=1 Tax=Pseudopedobacter beijingensis TaxID=1207056 RepID=A0ABW4I974_9SPHI